jgi:outer membrane protein OmpA-like peptidoglycan-associated protein
MAASPILMVGKIVPWTLVQFLMCPSHEIFSAVVRASPSISRRLQTFSELGEYDPCAFESQSEQGDLVSIKCNFVIATASIVLLASCAGQPETYTPTNAAPVTMPKGTLTGGASVGDANALAQLVVEGNNNAMAQFDQVNGDLSKLQATDNQELQNSQEALAKLEQLSNQQGSGQITLFFATGSIELNQEQQQRLIRFLDYLSRESRGRTVILVSVGSASAVGPAAVNRQLSIGRSQAPVAIIQQYLVNTPHTFYKVSAVGDMYAPKDVSLAVDQRYQNVRIVAAYSNAQASGT